MPTPVELPSLEDALDLAAGEHDFGDDPEDVLFAAEPQDELALSDSATEQIPQEVTAPVESDSSVFADLPEVEAAAPVPQGMDWNTTVELPGIEKPVPLHEVRDGYLRQADYTRKTQALAADRKAFEEQHGQALRLMENLTADPAGTAAYLAVKTGVVEESAVAGKVRQIQDGYQPPVTREQIEAEVEKRVAEAVRQHPAVLEATQVSIGQKVDRAFSQIEAKHQIKLTPKDRLAVLQRATKAGTGDLDLVVEGMLRQMEHVRAERDQARGAAGTRPSVRAPSADTPARIASVEDAFNQALSQGRGGAGAS